MTLRKVIEMHKEFFTEIKKCIAKTFDDKFEQIRAEKSALSVRIYRNRLALGMAESELQKMKRRVQQTLHSALDDLAIDKELPTPEPELICEETERMRAMRENLNGADSLSMWAGGSGEITLSGECMDRMHASMQDAMREAMASSTRSSSSIAAAPERNVVTREPTGASGGESESRI